MSESRKAIAEKAFQKMDKTGEGKITIKDLRRVYNVKSDTRYQSGEDSEEEILAKFVANFEREATLDGYVSVNDVILLTK